MSNIIESQNLPLDEKIYLKKDMFGWRIVHPIKTDNKINWVNLLFGGYRNLFFLIILLLLASFTMWSYNHDISEVKAYYGNISADPFYACAKNTVEKDVIPNTKIEWEVLKSK